MKKELNISIQEVEKTADLNLRLLAYLIDVFILVLVISLPFYYSFKYISGKVPFFEVIWLTPLILAYFILTETWYKATPAKLLLGLKVKSLKGELEDWQVFVRNLTKFSPVLLFIDTINCFLSKKNQRFTEIIANTEVIKV